MIDGEFFSIYERSYDFRLMEGQNLPDEVRDAFEKTLKRLFGTSRFSLEVQYYSVGLGNSYLLQTIIESGSQTLLYLVEYSAGVTSVRNHQIYGTAEIEVDGDEDKPILQLLHLFDYISQISEERGLYLQQIPTTWEIIELGHQTLCAMEYITAKGTVYVTVDAETCEILYFNQQKTNN